MNRSKKEAMIRELRKPKAPKDIEVESKNTRLRVILLICSVVVAIVAIGIGLSEAFSTDPGWHTVESEAQDYHCGGEFVMKYNYGASGKDPTDEEKAVKKLYTKATENAYDYFYREGQLSQIVPDAQVTLAPELYNALEMIQKAGNRSLYLAPVYVEYDRMFLSSSPAEAELYDPARDPELMAYVKQIAEYASDPEMIDLELLGNNTVCLRVRGAYATFAREYEITSFLDFGWMRNAFIADFIAQRFVDAGHTHGYIASYDGYTRNLDGSNTVYSQNLFDRLENAVYMPGSMDYQGPMSIVFWRNYPLTESDRWHFYDFGGGRIASVYLDPADGQEKSATDNLVSYSKTRSCAEILLETAPLYLTQTLDETALEALTEGQIYSLWFEGTQLRKTDPNVSVRVNTEVTEVTYDLGN